MQHPVNAVELWQLIIAVVVCITSIGGMIIIGWINMRTLLAELQQKYIALEKDIVDIGGKVNGQDFHFTEMRSQIPKMKEEIIGAINELKTDVAVIKTKMNNH